MKNRSTLIGLLIAGINLIASLSQAQVSGMMLDQTNDNYGCYFPSRSSGWQSFTAGTNGHLGAVQLWLYSTGSDSGSAGGNEWSATLRIREGEGMSGTVLAEQSITGDGVKQMRTFILETPVRQTAESIYTLCFESATTGLTVRASANVYINGRSHSSGYDYNFSTYLLNSDWSEEEYRDTNFTTSCTIISNEAQLAQFAYLVNRGHSFMGPPLTLTTNLDLSAHYWTPIGNRTLTFRGTFEGGSNIIHGVIIDQPDANYQGLFGHVNIGSIHDLHLTDVDISGGLYVGGLCGRTEGLIDCCTLSGCISGIGDVGGVVGRSGSNITDCVNNGSVYSDPSYGDGSQHVGGIAGECYGDIFGCSNSGSVEGAISVGGIVGNMQGTLDRCLNAGAITCDWNAGGIAAMARGTVQSCTNSGTVSGNSIGGIVAELNVRSMGITTGMVQHCDNSGSISGIGTYSVAGGISAWLVGTVQNSVNSGPVSGNSAGGISAFPEGIVQNCENSGSISGLLDEAENYSYAGGIAADVWDGTIRNCGNSGSVSGPDTNSLAGGIVGWNEEAYIDEEEPEYSTLGGTIQNCANCGAVSRLGLLGGLAGNNGGSISNSYWKQTGSEPFALGATATNDGTLANCQPFDTAPGTLASPVTAGDVTTDNLSKALNAWMIEERDAGASLRRWSVGSASVYPTLINSFWTDEGNYSTNWYDAAATKLSIGTAEELAGFAVLVNSEIGDFTFKQISLSADIELGNREWTPIGSVIDDDWIGFKGHFDGNGKTVSGIYVDNPSNFSSVGFFGMVKNCYIFNLSLKDVDISGFGAAGGLVGFFYYGYVFNNSVSGYVAGDICAGGIAGIVFNDHPNGAVWNCWSDAWISGKGYLGGLTGGDFKENGLPTCDSSYWKNTGLEPYNKPADGYLGITTTSCYSFAEVPGVLDKTGELSLSEALNEFVMSMDPPVLYGWTTGSPSNYPVMIPLICVNGEYIPPQTLDDGFTGGMTLAQVDNTVSVYTNTYPETDADSLGDLMKQTEMMGFTFADLSVDDAILDFDPILILTALDPIAQELTFTVSNGIDTTAIDAVNRLAQSIAKTPTVIQMGLTDGTEEALITSAQYHINGTATAYFTPFAPTNSMFFKMKISHEDE